MVKLPVMQTLDQYVLYPEKNTDRKRTTSRISKSYDSLISEHDSRLADLTLRKAAKAYLVIPTKALLLERCQTSGKQVHSLQDIKCIHLVHFYIRSFGYIQACHHLTICILHNNYLTNINALRNCHSLKRLDVHSNQIAKLPDESFWREMQALSILNLHDNRIGKMEHIQPLSVCSGLVALTLYDTPLSLTKLYRHRVVNSVCSLKALDHFVIADDEIIEEALCCERFGSMTSKLFVDLCPNETEAICMHTLMSEMKTVFKILSDINNCFVHGSPVVVIQRWARGYLCRKKYNISYAEVREKLKNMSCFVRETTPEESQAFIVNSDTYKNGGITAQNDFDLESSRSSFKIDKVQLEQNYFRLCEESSFKPTGTFDVFRNRNAFSKSSFIELLLGTILTEKADKEVKQPHAPVCSPNMPMKPEYLEKTARLPNYDDTNFTIPRVSGGYWNLSNECADKINEGSLNLEWNKMKKSFYVVGEKPTLAKLNAMHQHVINNKQMGEKVREAIEHWHELLSMRPRPEVEKIKMPPRLKGEVSLSTLVAISNAYRNRAKNYDATVKKNELRKLKEERKQAGRIVSEFKGEKRAAILFQKDDYRLHVTEAKQKYNLKKATLREHIQNRKEIKSQRLVDRQKDLAFVTNFSGQLTAISNAVTRNAWQHVREDIKKEKIKFVDEVKQTLKVQERLSQKYLKQYQQLKQVNATQFDVIPHNKKADRKLLKGVTDWFETNAKETGGKITRKKGLETRKRSTPNLQISKITNLIKDGKVQENMNSELMQSSKVSHDFKEENLQENVHKVLSNESFKS